MNRFRYLLAAIGVVVALAFPISAFAITSTTLTVTIPATMSISGYGASSYSATGAAGVLSTFSTGVQTVTGNDSLGYNVQTDAGSGNWVGNPNQFSLAVSNTTFSETACSAGITCVVATPLTIAMQTAVSKASAPAAGGDTFTLNYNVTPPASTTSGAYTLTVNEVLNAL